MDIKNILINDYILTLRMLIDKTKISKKEMKNSPILQYLFPNNESFGMACEHLLCEQYKIYQNIRKSRISNLFCEMYGDILKNEFKKIKELKYITKWIGGKNEKNDFITTQLVYINTGIFGNNIISYNNPTLSLKSNKGEGQISNTKVCPQVLGQSINSFKKYFDIDGDLRRYLENNIEKVMKVMFNHFFCCDKLLHIYFNIIERNFYLTYYDKKPSFKDNLNFTYHRGKNKLEWGSLTIKINDKNIVEIQLHANRTPFKYRFYWGNLHLISSCKEHQLKKD